MTIGSGLVAGVDDDGAQHAEDARSFDHWFGVPSECWLAVVQAGQRRSPQRWAPPGKFDAELTGNEWLSGTSSELGVFLLNDAILTRALYVLAVPDAPALPQKIKDIADPLIRIRVAPPRIEWMRRYLGWVGDTARRIVTFEEAKRFSDFEDQVIAFEVAYLALKGAAIPSLDQRIAAARAAATLTLYVSEGGSRLAFAAALLGTEKLEPMQRVEIEALANARRLRLL